jgi:hypothetical protein
MATRGRGAAPYAGIAQLTAAPEAEPLDLRPAAAHAPWLKPLGSYDRRETHELQVSRYG